MWLWRGLLGHSVTFATLFAFLILGISIPGSFQHLLGSLGVHWLYVLIIPSVAFGWLASREPRWLPDEIVRRRIARGILLAAVVAAILIRWLRS